METHVTWSRKGNKGLRDGSFLSGIPGSKLPGYYHSVPTGQKPPDTCPRNRLHSTGNGSRTRTTCWLRLSYSGSRTGSRTSVSEIEIRSPATSIFLRRNQKPTAARTPSTPHPDQRACSPKVGRTNPPTVGPKRIPKDQDIE